MAPTSEAAKKVAAANLRRGQAEQARRRLIDLTGTRFGRLLALKRDGHVGRRTAWLCQCDCGATVRQLTEVLRSGRAMSCGCLRAEQIAARSRKHGATVAHARTREYRSWLHAKGRCFNATDAKFPLYGGRGITMCERWRTSFEHFLADLGPAPNGMSLDRIDVNGNYEPGNCRWATAAQQASNTRANVYVDAAGHGRVTLKRFAHLEGVNYKSLHERIRRTGQAPADAVAYLRARAT